MDIPDSDRIKHRAIAFQEIHPDPDQAGTAARFLIELDGVLGAVPASPTLVRIQYDVLKLTLQEIEAALVGLGLHLNSGLLYRLKRALHHYADETCRANSGCGNCEINCTDKLFAKRYAQLEHGCRDDRPEHWRRYL